MSQRHEAASKAGGMSAIRERGYRLPGRDG
jgi:hypothetical protein